MTKRIWLPILPQFQSTAESGIILPGQTGEVVETHCVGSNDEKLKELMAKANPGVPLANGAHVASKGRGWSGAFNFTRFRTFHMAKKGYEIGGWTQVFNSDIVAKKTVTVNCSIGLSSCQEETTLTLKLADEPAAGTSPTR